MTETPDVVPNLSYFTVEELFEELRKRGYNLPTTVKVEVEGNTEPVEKWLDVWGSLERSRSYVNTVNQTEALTTAVYWLYLLLEPPSVREARKEGI